MIAIFRSLFLNYLRNICPVKLAPFLKQFLKPVNCQSSFEYFVSLYVVFKPKVIPFLFFSESTSVAIKKLKTKSIHSYSATLKSAKGQKRNLMMFAVSLISLNLRWGKNLLRKYRSNRKTVTSDPMKILAWVLRYSFIR